MENRMIDLEIKISNQEKLVDELNQEVYKQWVEIDLLKKQISYLIETLKSSDTKIKKDEKPPHY